MSTRASTLVDWWLWFINSYSINDHNNSNCCIIDVNFQAVYSFLKTLVLNVWTVNYVIQLLCSNKEVHTNKQQPLWTTMYEVNNQRYFLPSTKMVWSQPYQNRLLPCYSLQQMCHQPLKKFVNENVIFLFFGGGNWDNKTCIKTFNQKWNNQTHK